MRIFCVFYYAYLDVRIFGNHVFLHVHCKVLTLYVIQQNSTHIYVFYIRTWSRAPYSFLPSCNCVSFLFLYLSLFLSLCSSLSLHLSPSLTLIFCISFSLHLSPSLTLYLSTCLSLSVFRSVPLSISLTLSLSSNFVLWWYEWYAIYLPCQLSARNNAFVLHFWCKHNDEQSRNGFNRHAQNYQFIFEGR